MVSIEAGVAEATAEAIVAKVFTTVRDFVLSVLPRYTRPVLRSILMQGATSLSAVSPDFNLNGGKTVAV